MIKRFSIAALWMFWFISFHGMADQPEKDSLAGEVGGSALEFLDNLDSLLNLYYVKQSLMQDTSLVQESFESDSTSTSYPDSVYIVRLSKVPSVVSLPYNHIVRNYINVYTQKKKDKMEVMLGMSDYYFPLIEQIFDQEDLPVELKYMAVIESALNPRARSRAGAVGLWQFMYSTGKMYGLTINSLVDERRDPIRSTYAAARFLKDLYGLYHDWILVIAAYNCGPGNVNKAIRRSGGVKDYWKIYYRLPRETRGYVPAYIAAVYTMNYYRDHGLKPVTINIPVMRDTLIVQEDLHLCQVADVLHIPLQQLRDMNPQYRRDIIPGSIRPFTLVLPLQYTGKFIDFQDSIFTYKDSIYFDPSRKILAPQYTRYNPPPPKGCVKIYYTVKQGDNLGFISEWFHVRISDLRYWNHIRHNMIRVGQRLAVYVPKSKVSYYKKFNHYSFAEKQRLSGNSAIQPKGVKQGQPLDEHYEYYRVRRGDTIWEIARKYDGVTENDILKLNNLSRRDKIRPGQHLKIRRKS